MLALRTVEADGPHQMQGARGHACTNTRSLVSRMIANSVFGADCMRADLLALRTIGMLRQLLFRPNY